MSSRTVEAATFGEDMNEFELAVEVRDAWLDAVAVAESRNARAEAGQ